MLSGREAMEPVANAGNTTRIPMVDLPFSGQELINIIDSIDAIIVTHTHRDHWDTAAQALLPKEIPVFCQPGNEKEIAKQGFSNAIPVDNSLVWKNIRLYRTHGQHGTGEIGAKMGHVSGFVIEHDNKRIYIAGDTIWCDDVLEAVNKYQPNHIIVNGGCAKFVTGDPITMNIHDVLSVAGNSDAKVHVVHLETINHCRERRSDYHTAIHDNNLAHQIFVPEDGAWLKL